MFEDQIDFIKVGGPGMTPGGTLQVLAASCKLLPGKQANHQSLIAGCGVVAVTRGSGTRSTAQGQSVGQRGRCTDMLSGQHMTEADMW